LCSSSALAFYPARTLVFFISTHILAVQEGGRFKSSLDPQFTYAFQLRK
jgi:hypothetical protein